MNYERLLLDNLGSVDEVIRSIARRQRLSKVEVDEFTSYVHLRLIEHDYRVLRKFQQRSQLTTYLVTVIGRMFADYRNRQWGKWRPSAQAKRLGPSAVLLDRLVTRDRHPLEEAIQIMRITHRVPESEQALRSYWEQIPVREPEVEVSLNPVTEAEAAESADEADRAQRMALIVTALNAGAAALGAADLALVRLHAIEGLTLVQLAARLGIHESAMRRRWNAIKKVFRKAFISKGLEPSDVERLMDGGRLHLPATFLDDDPDGR